jgi:hypothetical protein
MSCNAIDARLSHYIEDAASGHDVQEERPREWHLNEAVFMSRVINGVRRRVQQNGNLNEFLATNSFRPLNDSFPVLNDSFKTSFWPGTKSFRNMATIVRKSFTALNEIRSTVDRYFLRPRVLCCGSIWIQQPTFCECVTMLSLPKLDCTCH